MTDTPEPVERCGYTVEPVTGRDGTFNPLTGQMRIGKDGTHALFPARLYSELNDEQFAIVASQLWYQTDSPTIFEVLAEQARPLLAAAIGTRPMPLPMKVTKVVSYVTVSREQFDEARSIFRVPTPEERAEAEARHAAYKARKKAEHAEAVTEWEQLREQHAGSPAVVAVLDIHHPDDEGRMECAHLTFGYEADAEDWPCTTYTAIKEATP